MALPYKNDIVLYQTRHVISMALLQIVHNFYIQLKI